MIADVFLSWPERAVPPLSIQFSSSSTSSPFLEISSIILPLRRRHVPAAEEEAPSLKQQSGQEVSGENDHLGCPSKQRLQAGL